MSEKAKKDKQELGQDQQKLDDDKQEIEIETPADEKPEEKAADKADKKEEKEEKKGFGKKTVSKAKYEKLEEELEKAKQEIADLKDSRLRLLAEYDNFKRRSLKEKDRIYSDALADVTASWLPVLDNLERAAASAEKLDASSDKDAVKQVADGIDLIRKQADQALEKIGVKEIKALNEPFDPQLHEAVMRVDGDGDEETVVEVFAKGYIFGDRVIRHSVVKVAN